MEASINNQYKISQKPMRITGSNIFVLVTVRQLHVVLICQEELVALQKQLEEQELRNLKEQAGAEVVTSDGNQSREKGLCCSILADQNSLA